MDAELILSPEPDQLLGTGGGLLHVAPHFRRDAPFFLHVGDVISEMDLRGLYPAQRASDALVTLAVHEREAARCLLFDRRGLYGRDNLAKDWRYEVRRPDGTSRRIAFAGAHVVSPGIFDRFTERGAFDILDAYLRMASEGARIAPFEVSGARWLEIGNPNRLEQARQALERASPS